MRTTSFYYLAIILFSLISTDFYAQNIDADSLMGRWQLDYNLTCDRQNTKQKNMLSNLSGERLSFFKNSYVNRTLNFKSNSIFTLELQDGTMVEAVWECMPDRILNISKGEYTTQYYVEFISDNRLILKRLGDDESMVFSVLYYIKTI
ncbi:hypothetical protein [Sinomicrobium sp. M5D2P9]